MLGKVASPIETDMSLIAVLIRNGANLSSAVMITFVSHAETVVVI